MTDAVGEGGHTYPVRDTVTRFSGRVFTVVTDTVEMPGGDTAARDYLRHTGAVGVVALDEAGRVVLVRQYRHALRHALWELPAGLIDVAGEPEHETARRELAEETDLVAHRLDLLLDLHTTPGCSDERIRLFLARDLSPVPEAERHLRRDEEAELVVEWFDLDHALTMALEGAISNGPTVAGLFAAARCRDADWAGLRPADAAPPI